MKMEYMVAWSFASFWIEVLIEGLVDGGKGCEWVGTFWLEFEGDVHVRIYTNERKGQLYNFLVPIFGSIETREEGFTIFGLLFYGRYSP